MGQTLLHLSIPILVRSRNTDWSLVKSDNLKWKSTIFSLTNSFLISLGSFHGNGFGKTLDSVEKLKYWVLKISDKQMFKKINVNWKLRTLILLKKHSTLDLWVIYFICLQIGMTQIDAEMDKTFAFDNFFRGTVFWKIMRAKFRNSYFTKNISWNQLTQAGLAYFSKKKSNFTIFLSIACSMFDCRWN